jgi:hypothetical protein
MASKDSTPKSDGGTNADRFCASPLSIRREFLTAPFADYGGNELARRIADGQERQKWLEELCDGREGGSDERPVWLCAGYFGDELEDDWSFTVWEWSDYALDPYEPQPDD